jgi:predicted nucleotide-binding protein (sugar kinase/HSP70/actin superfamily)
MARSFDPSLPRVLSPVMDLGDRRVRWARDWYDLAGDLGAGQDRASAAVKNMMDGLHRAERVKKAAPAVHPSREITVGVAGHLYNVYDPRASLGLLERIRAMGAEAVTAEEVPRREARRQLRMLPRKIRWDFESRMVGSILHWSRTASVSGVIYVSSFACGPGSIIGALIEDELGREKSVPLMGIVLDEHSAEGGLVTRIEAFLDMLKWVSRDARSGENAAGGTRRR